MNLDGKQLVAYKESLEPHIEGMGLCNFKPLEHRTHCV